MKAEKVQPRTYADITEAVIKAWKEKYTRGIFEIAVNTDEIIEEKEEKDDRGRKKMVTVYQQKKGIFRKPNRQEISASLTIKNDPLGQAEEIMRDCWLGGDEELLNDDDYFTAAMVQFQEVVAIREAEIKKL